MIGSTYPGQADPASVTVSLIVTPITITPSGTETLEKLDAATATVAIGVSAIEGAGKLDSATAVVTITPGVVRPQSTIVKTFDSGVTSGVGTSTTITVPATGVAIGNTLIIASSKLVTGASDSKGNSYTIDKTQTGAGTSQGASIIRAPITVALVSGDVITLTHANLAGRIAIAIELTGLAASPLDTAGFGGFDVT